MQVTGDLDDNRVHEISQIITAARRNAGHLPGFPGALPATLDDAYAVQDYSRSQWNHPVIGWKVGGIPPAQAEVLGAGFLAGPIFEPYFVKAQAGAVSQMPIFANGFAAIEPEFILQLGATRDEDRVFIGAEIASSPIVDINGFGALAVICDFGNNRGLLLGPEIADWRERFASPMTVTAHINGAQIGQRVLDDPAAGMLASRDFLIEHARQRNMDLPTGTLISTGAITGIHEAVVGATSTLDFADAGSVQLELVAQQPEV